MLDLNKSTVGDQQMEMVGGRGHCSACGWGHYSGCI